MIISHNDDRLSWLGAVSLERTSSFTRPWRISFDQRGLFPAEILKPASWQSGIRLTFRSTTRRLQMKCESYEGSPMLDLYLDGRFFQSSDMDDQGCFSFDEFARGEKTLEVWLPHAGSLAVKHLEIDDDSELQPAANTQLRWITYGSSITQCSAASSPSRTWPGIVSRDRSLNLTCLGYAGQCHLDPQIAFVIRELPADFISLCIGINIYGLSSLSARSFPASLIGFVRLIREKHPTVPLLLISPIFSFDRETTPNKVGWSLIDYRRSVAESADLLREAGDASLYYLDGLELFNSNYSNLMPDRLHPNSEGYHIIAENFLAKSGRFFLKKTGK